MDLLEIVWNFEPRVIPSMKMPVWYGIMWALGFLIGLKILEKMYKSEDVPDKLLDHSFIYVLVGGIVGARLGHCFFYDSAYYLSNPTDILKIWEGGLASHGGAIGIILSSYLLTRKYPKISILWLLDMFVVPTALAAGLIRLGNLFNHEIVGKVTGSDFGFKFLRHDIPTHIAVSRTGGDPSNPGKAYDLIANDPMYAEWLAAIPNRYPAQLYEAICYFVIFAVLFFLYWKTNSGKLIGFLSGVFFILLFGARFFIEFIKENQTEAFTEKDALGNVVNAEGLNMGQYLSIPLVLFGCYLVLRKIKSLKKGKDSAL